MDGMHDLGGKQGFGPVRHQPHAPVFHEPWEKRINALYGLAVRLGVFNMDEYRHAIERMEPRHYLSAGYYERTLTSLATLCVEKGVLTQAELQSLAGGAFPLALPLGPGRGNVAPPASFQPGDRVRTRAARASHHTRLPGYAQGKLGIVERVHGVHLFADSNAQGLGEQPQWLYGVVFDGTELWGAGAAPGLRVAIDAWEPYLDLA